MHKEWVTAWEGSVKPRVSIAAQQPPSRDRLALHRGLEKAESSVLVQARTGVIGLREYLFRRRVPEIDTLYCEECKGGYYENLAYILVACSYEDERRLWRRGTTYRDMVTNPLLVKRTTS